MAGLVLKGLEGIMTGSTLGTIVSIVVVVIVLMAGIAVVFYADSHPEWRHRAPSRHGIAGPAARPAVPHQEESPGLAARDTEASAAAGQDPGAPARPQTGIYAGRARADLFRAAASAVRCLTAE